MRIHALELNSSNEMRLLIALDECVRVCRCDKRFAVDRNVGHEIVSAKQWLEIDFFRCIETHM